ncbi:SAM-dependent methyltransferase [Allomuricauda sp. SCSIO 65647]|uniref:SAM-dependent methyltransferase n=1 Tax=Allomuricauda sp. SCSIO 65647 TaxID=2908843 RepID=UPI001F3C2997|nr:SAM-dependent methyltransferase [Muricauda sp. SCSIO 65647]UJH67621.1 SAM-dependent methyltransferase [Muricauda sp. SCSIO 65647]
MADSIGKLYLIPTPLGDGGPLEVLPISVKWAIENIEHYIVENERSARRFIKKISPKKSQPDLNFDWLNKFTNPEEIPTFLEPCLQGHDMGLLSEAGCPAIADPGAQIVRLAHEKNIKVIPLVGPSSVLMAMMSSGLNGQNFAFNGYLAIENSERKKQIKQLEKKSADTGQSQVFIETPYRNDKMLVELVKTLKSDTLLCVATDISLSTEYIKTQTAHDWGRTQIELNKRPSIFIIQA